MAVDQPRDPAGEWWLDITVDGFTTSVGWRPAHGFAILTDSDAYGSGADEIYRDAETAAERVAQMEEHARRQESRALNLKDVRQLCHRQQLDVARALNIQQGTISRLENRLDAKVSTVAAFVEALGGSLELRVKFDGFEAPVVLERGDAPKAKRRAPVERRLAR